MSKSLNSESPDLRLAKYLRQFVGLRSTTVRDLNEYDDVLMFSDIPQERDCISPAWTDEYDSESPWLEVKKQKFEKSPSPPEITSPWIDEPELRQAKQEIPPLLSTIFLPDNEAEIDEGEEPPLVQHSLADHPKVQQAYENYRPIWEAWSREQRKRESIQQVYAKLFQLHTQIKKQGEVTEVVLGLGLLNWAPKLRKNPIQIRRHVFVTGVELEFDVVGEVIRVMPPGEGARLKIEDDMLEGEHRPDRLHYLASQEVLEEIGNDIWDRAQIYNAIKSWSGALSPDSVYSEQLEPETVSGDEPVVTFAPALILRKRSQAGMVRVYDELIEQMSTEGSEIPNGWNQLTNDTRSASVARDSTGESDGQSVSEIFFPLPVNQEQKQIVQAIEKESGVLVQGPPGTGKSHTIANLICHLLATGKRVLITAESARALQVLKDKLPKEIHPLCVSLLGQGGNSFAELDNSIQGISTRQASFSSITNQNRITELDMSLDSSRRQLAELDSKIHNLRAEETSPYKVGNGVYRGTASTIAERVANERDLYSWLKLPDGSDNEPPLTSQELLDWLKISRRHTAESIAESKLQVPLISEILSPDYFVIAVQDEKEATDQFNSLEELRSHPAYLSLKSISTENRENLQRQLKSITSHRNQLDRFPKEDWIYESIEKFLTSSHWVTLTEQCHEILDQIKSLQASIGNRKVELPSSMDAKKIRSDAIIAASFLKSGRQWKSFGFLTPQQLKGKLYLKEEVLVDGLPANTSQLLEIVRDDLDLKFSLEELQELWQDFGIPPLNSNPVAAIAMAEEILKKLEMCQEYTEACDKAGQFMSTLDPVVPEPNWQKGEGEEWLKLIQSAFIEDKLLKAKEKFDSCLQLISPLIDLHDTHPVVNILVSSIEQRDVKTYSEGYAAVTKIEQLRVNETKRKKIEEILEVHVPSLIESISLTIQDENWDSRLKSWSEAWYWALADLWLEQRSDFDYQQQLLSERKEVDLKIGKLLGESAAYRAWGHFFERLSPEESAALKGWREIVRTIGKGTGRSAKIARLKKEGRQYMNQCRDAIPVWIMPRYLVAEMVDPAPKRYDLVIVDEASQLGIDSLFLFYIAKKMIVVGDDQQISPYGIGIKDDEIAGLQRNLLEGVPHQHALSAQSSLYANAKIRFDRTIVLREHFRCMPEIIQFSNDLCYASNGTPLDPIRAYPADRLEPLMLRHVSEGYRTGGSQSAQNPPEADAIVDQIKSCLKDPKYRQATMGVISLQGNSQAKLIEQKVLKSIDPEDIEARRIICGDAYAFQGDERNIIFMSMVAAPGDNRIGTLSNESARQRFNVAASRAQDQLWLFHTAQIDMLSTSCMRYRLLSYMLNPSRQITDENRQVFDSGFEEDVYRRLTDRGFHVRTQVQVGDSTNHRYRIDLVVEGMKGRLAVECDGDFWHGADRYEYDMARQRDLERAGWKFSRIRGGDFYRDPEKAMEPVWLELKRLGIQPGGVNQFQQPTPEDVDEDRPAEPTPVKEDKRPESDGTLTIAPESVSSVPENSEPNQQEPDQDLSLDDDTSQVKEKIPYISFEKKAGLDPRSAKPGQITNGLYHIIKAEGPMVVKRAYDVYLRGCGINRMGEALRRKMDRSLRLAIKKELIEVANEMGKKDSILSIARLKETPPIIVRSRGPRKLEEIPPSEIQVVARQLMYDHGYELSSDQHIRAILSFFELKRLTKNVKSSLTEILHHPIDHVDAFFESRGTSLQSVEPSINQ